MGAKHRGVDNILRLPPHKILINYKDRNGDIVVEKQGRHQFSQMIKFDNTKEVRQAHIACSLMWCTETATVYFLFYSSQECCPECWYWQGWETFYKIKSLYS